MMISSTVETGDFDEPKRCSELLIAQEVPPVEEIAGVREGLWIGRGVSRFVDHDQSIQTLPN